MMTQFTKFELHNCFGLQRDGEYSSWAPTGMGREGHLPSARKVEKCYRVKKNSIFEVNLNGRDAAFP